MQFANPGWLVLLVLVPLPVLFERARARVLWPSLAGFGTERRWWTWRLMFRYLPGLVRGSAIGALALALARPQTVGGVTKISGQGVAIVVALDQSSSMTTSDFPADLGTRRISRLEAAKQTFLEFVKGRPDDLVGLVVFANYPDLTCPPTPDHRFLAESVEMVRSAKPGDDGTNLGDAVAWGLDALRNTTPSKKVLVLLTDGNNEPAVPRPLDPLAAATLARDMGVTLHTIAIGREGGVVRDVDPATSKITISETEGPNVPLLERMAEITGGQSFIAADANALQGIFGIIDNLEKSQIRSEILTRYDERFTPWAMLALGLLILDRFLVYGPLRRIP